MQSGYTIWAYSPSLNEEHRWFDLAQVPHPVEDQQLAQRLADSAAYTFNQQHKNNATDWVGVIKLENVGIETLDGYLFHTGG